MIRKLIVEREPGGNALTVRDGVFRWHFFSTKPGFLVTRTDHSRREVNSLFNGQTEAQGFLVEILSERLDLSDFWNGQTVLPFTTNK